MLKRNLKFLFLITVITMCFASNLPAAQNIPKIIIESSCFENRDEYIEKFIKKINDPRIVYKDGKVIFYPNPNVQAIQNKIILVAIFLFICTISVILIPISFILLFVEIVHLCNLARKNSLLSSTTPHIVLDDHGIKIRKQNTFWCDISNINKEEITKYSNGWEQSRQTLFNFYDKYLNCLFTLNDQDEYIEMSFDKLISLIYYFLEKSKTQFTQSVNKTTISENTTYQPVYRYQ